MGSKSSSKPGILEIQLQAFIAIFLCPQSDNWILLIIKQRLKIG